MKSVLLGFVLSIAAGARATSLLVEYPVPSPEQIELLPAGSTQSLLPSPFFPSSVDIRVRMFPILSSPPLDPYPVVKNPFLIEMVNRGGLKVLSRPEGILLAKGKALRFDFSTDEFLVDEERVKLREIEIVPDDSNVTTDLLWDRGDALQIGASLRGRLIVMKTSYVSMLKRFKNVFKDNDEIWSVINELPLNFYLQSVLPSEILPNWHIEALKTQAVAARTYALYEMAEARTKYKRVWDVDPTTWFQSYRGVTFRRGDREIRVEDQATNQAVKDSRHKVLTYNKEVIKAYFSSNSGGVTCSAKECFNLLGENPPYLKSVPDHEGVIKMPYGTWGENANVTKKTVKEKLLMMGFPDGLEVAELVVNTTGDSGRVWGMKVKLAQGADIILNRLQSSAVMTLFGGIRSYLFKLFAPDQKGKQKVVGHGLGHGVGMSQYGALLFAQDGWSSDKILTHYYNGVQLYSISNEVDN